jgi:hypothetical protein
MKRLNVVLMLGLLVSASAPVMAQRPTPRDSSKKASQVPADARPPKGMCRIWIDGVPAAQQPAATDCPSAIKNRPSNGRVIFGDDDSDSSRSKPAEKPKLPADAKGFSGVKPLILPRRPPG